jgi:geranylgeranyl diphosphate synthase, type I
VLAAPTGPVPLRTKGRCEATTTTGKVARSRRGPTKTGNVGRDTRVGLMLGSTVRHTVVRKAQFDMGQPEVRAPSAVAALDQVHGPIDALLEEFLDARLVELAKMDPGLERIGREISDFVRGGGKRLRPAFVYWGHRATGAEHRDGVLAPAAAVELLHNFALIHDDVMDRSAERRGRPTVHESLASSHAGDGLVGDARWFGVGGAILAGDLAFVWADQILDGADLPQEAVSRARQVFTELRVEVMAGQYLDLRLAAQADVSLDEAMRVALLKSGRYTVTRPLLLGAAIGGEDPELARLLTAYGDAVGIAFQLRDDVLGLFGDPSTTGKGVLDDLREGKRTVLMLHALQLTDDRGRTVLRERLGNPTVDEDDAERVREVVYDCGALSAVEQLLAERQRDARRALEGLEGPARAALEELADLAAFRVV